MTNDQIEKFLGQKATALAEVQIRFKTRSSIKGIFIKTADYSELKVKNFWRIVGEKNIQEYKKSSDHQLAKIFSGSEFTKLELV
jgi:hypothetical protein